MNLSRKFSGFTLVELLVVISIIALLLSIMLPGLNAAREKARRVVCASNVKSLTMSAIMYGTDNKSYLPLWWGGMTHRLSVSHESGVATTNGTTEHLKYYNRVVNLGYLYPNYIKDGHAFYCASGRGFRYESNTYYGDNRFGFKYMDEPDTEFGLNTVGSSYQYRGSLDPDTVPVPGREGLNLNPMNDPRRYKIIKILERYPRWIILADYGGMKYSNQPGLINHTNNKGQPAYFNNGYADGHVEAYKVKKPWMYPLVSSPFDGAYILKRMESNFW